MNKLVYLRRFKNKNHNYIHHKSNGKINERHPVYTILRQDKERLV